MGTDGLVVVVYSPMSLPRKTSPELPTPTAPSIRGQPKRQPRSLRNHGTEKTRPKKGSVVRRRNAKTERRARPVLAHLGATEWAGTALAGGSESGSWGAVASPVLATHRRAASLPPPLLLSAPLGSAGDLASHSPLTNSDLELWGTGEVGAHVEAATVRAPRGLPRPPLCTWATTRSGAWCQ
jgi:hypothetical protein